MKVKYTLHYEGELDLWEDEVADATQYAENDEERKEHLDEYIAQQLWNLHNGYYSHNDEFNWEIVE